MLHFRGKRGGRPDGFAGLPDGSYALSLTPDRLIYQRSASATTSIDVVAGVSTPVLGAFSRVASPWKNATDRYDVDANGAISPLDALRVINDLSRHGSHIRPATSQITVFYDTSDDGAVSVLDALQVLNEISRRKHSSGSGEATAVSADAVFAAWDPTLEKQKRGNPQ